MSRSVQAAVPTTPSARAADRAAVPVLSCEQEAAAITWWNDELPPASRAAWLAVTQQDAPWLAAGEVASPADAYRYYLSTPEAALQVTERLGQQITGTGPVTAVTESGEGCRRAGSGATTPWAHKTIRCGDTVDVEIITYTGGGGAVLAPPTGRVVSVVRGILKSKTDDKRRGYWSIAPADGGQIIHAHLSHVTLVKSAPRKSSTAAAAGPIAPPAASSSARPRYIAGEIRLVRRSTNSRAGATPMRTGYPFRCEDSRQQALTAARAEAARMGFTDRTHFLREYTEAGNKRQDIQIATEPPKSCAAAASVSRGVGAHSELPILTEAERLERETGDPGYTDGDGGAGAYGWALGDEAVTHHGHRGRIVWIGNGHAQLRCGRKNVSEALDELRTPPTRFGYVRHDGATGAGWKKVSIIGETPKSFRIRSADGTEVRIAGLGRKAGPRPIRGVQVAMVPKGSVELDPSRAMKGARP